MPWSLQAYLRLYWFLCLLDQWCLYVIRNNWICKEIESRLMFMLYMIHDTYVCACVCVQRERERKRRLWRNQNTWFLGLSNPKKKCEVLAI